MFFRADTDAIVESLINRSGGSFCLILDNPKEIVVGRPDLATRFGATSSVKAGLFVSSSFAGAALNGVQASMFQVRRFNSDARVGNDSNRQAQSFRSEDDGLLPLSIYRSALH
jgi:hypothetical protein